jgi:hypothetical protein
VTRWSRLAVLVCIAPALVAGCRSKPGAMSPDRTAPTPPYEAIAEIYNARAGRLGRIWSRAVVQVRYIDADGKQRGVQGEGHLQVIQPDRLALSAGKLGETLFWLGGDADRFWAFELGDASRASVGRHENVGRPCARPLAAPVHPLEALDLLGVTALPAEASPVAWSADGRSLVVEFPGRFGPQRIYIDPLDYLPVRIELLDPRDGSAAIFATLEQHERVWIDGSPGYNPRMATRIVIEHPGSESEVRLTLSDMTDGSERGRLADAVFAFESLLRAFRPDEIVVLDEACPRPAYAAALEAGR